MHPYAGFRLEGELIYEEPCIELVPPEGWYLMTKDGLYYRLLNGGRYIVKH